MSGLGSSTHLDRKTIEKRYQMGYRVFSFSLQFSSERVRDEYVATCHALRKDFPDIKFVVRPIQVSTAIVKNDEEAERAFQHMKSQMDLAKEIGATACVFRLEDPLPPSPDRGTALANATRAIHKAAGPNPIPLLVENTRGVEGGTDVGSLSFLLSLFDGGHMNICFNPTAAWSRGEKLFQHGAGELSEKKLAQLISFIRQSVRLVVLSPVSEEVAFGSHQGGDSERVPLARARLQRNFLAWLVKYCQVRGIPVIMESPSGGEDVLIENLTLLRRWAHG
jgi:endonuclease IV